MQWVGTMRDLLISAIVFGSIPFILRRPFVGLLVWVWLGIMNPHRLAWGFAYDLPFAQIVAISTLIGAALNGKRLYPFPFGRVSLMLILFALWLGISPLFSFHPDEELGLWLRAVKIQFMVLIAFILMAERAELHRMTWVLALSVGFFGIKGGVFTVATAAQHRVWGPAGSFIEDNNTLALAIVMAVPLFRYLQLHAEGIWARRACLAAIVLCVISALGSYSRGALLALSAMAVFLWLQSRHKGFIGILLLLAVPLAFMLMPDTWTERMASIGSYDRDASSLGRINAWWMAWNLALDRFPIGGGFAIYNPDHFARYAPNPGDIHAAHSIYFQILGEHGFVGLALFVGVFAFAWFEGAWVVRNTRERAGFEWAHDLAAMCQVSLVGYMVGGAFLSLTYFDLPYYVVAVLVVLRSLVRRELAEPRETKAVPA